MKAVFVSAIILGILHAVSAYSLFGCYVDKSKRILESKPIQSHHMTVEMCVQTCTERGNYFAAVEYSWECWCGDYLQPYKKVSISECSMACNGAASEKCGDLWRADVYTTNAESYIGCYQDKSARILEGHKISLPIMTSKLCIGICKLEGKRFAMTEYSSHCYCGNNLQPYAKKPDSECNYKCSGNKYEMCGGNWRGSLYLVGYNDY